MCSWNNSNLIEAMNVPGLTAAGILMYAIGMHMNSVSAVKAGAVAAENETNYRKQTVFG